jgi:hypothetical protein
MAYPTTDRALVRYRNTKAQAPNPDAEPKVPTVAAVGAGVLVTPTAPPTGTPKDGHTSEEFILDPPTNSIAEVEKRWREANKDGDKEWVDADLLAASEPKPPAEPVLANETLPGPGVPQDAQIVRERAAGRTELPGTVTEDAEVKETKGKIRPASDKSATTPQASTGTSPRVAAGTVAPARPAPAK